MPVDVGRTLRQALLKLTAEKLRIDQQNPPIITGQIERRIKPASRRQRSRDDKKDTTDCHLVSNEPRPQAGCLKAGPRHLPCSGQTENKNRNESHRNAGRERLSMK